MLSAENQYLLDERVRTSKLLGANKCLVLHGGGNTSVKITEKNILGNEEEILYVKGSGWDLETITQNGFSPVRLNHLKKLAKLTTLSDSEMVNQLVTHLTRSTAPVPSVEAILHAVIPYRYVDHTHADAIIAISNSINGEKILREIYQDSVVYIPYVMPGFDLSKLCATLLENNLNNEKIGLILFNHGVFSFGESANECYNRMLELVGLAEKYLEENVTLNTKPILEKKSEDKFVQIAGLRKKVSDVAGFPVILKCISNLKSLSFCNRPDLQQISQQGPATPDHVIRTKRVPLIGRNLEEYAAKYKTYFLENEPLAKERKKMLDPAPRVILDSQIGLCVIGKTVKDAQIVSDIYDHTIDIIEKATELGGYKALPAKDIFDVEYWDLEQAKLSKSGNTPVFSGEVALVTGAASGIGKACVESLLKRGAAVVGLDLNPVVVKIFNSDSYIGIECDITSDLQVIDALNKTIQSFGGLDILVLNAGIFPASSRVENLKADVWEKVMRINLDSNLMLLQKSYPFLKIAPKGGRVSIIGSKNVAAPGPGAAAYSVSKAALNQLARVVALEWGKEGIRINTVHPNAVFDTGIWTDEVLSARAKSYGLTIDEYKRNNVLGNEISSKDVSELAIELCGSLFSKTTGAQIPVDGGNERVI